MFKITICLLLPLLASGCASTPSYDDQLGSWVGRSQGELFADWGAPSEVLTDESGATATEYIILLILIACVVIAVVKLFGNTVSAKFDSANDAVRRELTFG